MYVKAWFWVWTVKRSTVKFGGRPEVETSPTMSIRILLTHPCGYPSKIRLLSNLQSGNKEQINRHVNWICAESLLSSDCDWLSYYASCYVDIGDVIGWLCDVIMHTGIGENFAIRKKTHPKSRQSLMDGEILARADQGPTVSQPSEGRVGWDTVGTG